MKRNEYCECGHGFLAHMFDTEACLICPCRGFVKAENDYTRLWVALIVIAALHCLALTASAQRIPGRRDPSNLTIITLDRERWPDGTPKDDNGTKLSYLASDNRVYFCFVRDAQCVMQVPRGVIFPPEALKAGTKTIFISDRVNIGVFKPPDPPKGPPGRRRVALPPVAPINIPALVGVELHAMPAPVVLNYIAANYSAGTYIVIMSADGKTFIIFQVQGGLPMPPGWRKVWP